MKDQEARKEIEYLKERIRVLERDSRVGLTECEKLYTANGGVQVRQFGASLDDAIELILEHLGLELKFVPYVSAHHILVQKGDKQ